MQDLSAFLIALVQRTVHGRESNCEPILGLADRDSIFLSELIKGIVAGLPGHLVPVHPAAGPAPHAGQQRSQPSHLPLRQAG
jgi:hypothetical protein